MLEMYDGKVTVNITDLDEVTRHHLYRFKEELNKHMEKLMKNKKGNKQDSMTNAQIHRSNMIGGR